VLLRSWSLGAKLIAISLAAVVVTAGACLAIERSIIRQQGIDLTRNAMRGVLVESESVRQSVSNMQQSGVFDPKLLTSGSVTGDYRKSAVYQTVPVVSAWTAVGQAAADEGYRFHIAAHSPRNPKNAVGPTEEGLLRQFEQQGAQEYFAVDEAREEIVYARPIRLARDCLMCHGDPANSPTHDGRDIVGLQMENWKEGQVHGAFVLTSNLDAVAAVTQAGMLKTLIWIVPLALLVGGLVYFLMRTISARLGAVATELGRGSSLVDRMVSQLQSASFSLAQAATEQATSLQQTSTSSIEIKSMVGKTTGNTSQVVSLVSASQERYKEANSSLDDMVAAMGDISAQSNKIAQIIKVIDEIAFQTHMLALNASVEAARAGDAGMGFSVVASEVGNLARRCTQAASDTASLIEESMVKSVDGQNKVNQVVSVIRAITEESARVKQLVEEVGTGSMEQARGVDQIAKAVHQMEQVTHTTAAHAEEGSASANALNAESQKLKRLVSRLNIIVRGQRV
jgi:methyl-accepting chemotaxis protein